MSCGPHSPRDDNAVPASDDSVPKGGFYDTMRCADRELTELLKSGYRFSKGGDELIPVGGSEIVATPFLVRSILDETPVPQKGDS